MKYGIPPGVLALIGIGAGFHSVPEEQAPAPEKLRRLAEPQRPAIIVAVPAESKELGDSGTLKPAAVPMKSPVAGSVPIPPVRDSSWQKLGDSLGKSLELTTLQLPEVEGILSERENQIRICHEEIRKSGVLDIRTYEWQVGLMKSSWYRRIDSLLDGRQHQLFAALVEQGFFNDGLALTVEPGMTVLE
jgi:hypothetical protein